MESDESFAHGDVPRAGVVSQLKYHVEDVVSHRAMVSENCLGISRKDTNARWLLTSLPSSSCSGNETHGCLGPDPGRHVTLYQELIDVEAAAVIGTAPFKRTPAGQLTATEPVHAS